MTPCDRLLDLLEALDGIVESEAHGIVKRINGGTYESAVFTNMFSIDELESHLRPKEIRGKKGIYIFTMKGNYSLSAEQIRRWNSKVNGAGFKKYEAIELHKGQCLYLGSCVSESLYVRIGQHMGDKGEATGLKLSHSTRSFLKNAVHVYVFPISNNYNPRYYRYILPQIERSLHDKLEPVAGSKRV